MSDFFHSVTLDKDLCHGCTNCVKRCPTEAIRVRGGKAQIIKERCIDCGECIRICPYHAKLAVVDPLSVIDNYKYTIALPAPSLYGQFAKAENPDIVLTALKHIGFDDVFEVAAAAEVVSAMTRQLIARGELKKPVISSACPAILRIIRVRFPSLIPNILPLRSPMEFAARWAKKRVVQEKGIPYGDIGAIFISPCPAKVTAIKMPLGTVKSYVDAAVSMAEVYGRLAPVVKELSGGDVAAMEELASAGGLGIGWGRAGGETAALRNDRYIAADGIENVIRVLEDLEDDRLEGVDFVELNACTGGCVGGVLAVERPYMASARVKKITKLRRGLAAPQEDTPLNDIWWDSAMQYEPVMRLDEDIATAMHMLEEIRRLSDSFNGMDCGACGAPSCRALAEDIVRGFATEDLCIYRMRERLQSIDGGAPAAKKAAAPGAGKEGGESK